MARCIKKLGLVVTTFLVCLLGILLPAAAVAADITQPEEFYGNITANGAAAPAGTVIVAKIGEVEKGSFTTTEAGKYGGSGTFDPRLIVSGEEADRAKTITFWVNGSPADQTAIYEPGESTELNLTAWVYPLQSSDIQITRALNYLRQRQAQQSTGSIGGFSVDAWVVMAIAAAGEDPDDWAAGTNSIVDYLKNNRASLGDIATDWARSILAITAADEDPANFGGFDYVAELKSYYESNQIGSASLLNDDFWGVLALISAGESQSSAIITDSVAFIKANQNTDHGWGLTVTGDSDADNTAAAIMALIAAGESPGSTVIDNALDYLKTLQQNDGGFASEGVTNSGVDAWVINAITDAGQSPVGNEWKQSGKNPIEHLLSLQDTDGAFKWTAAQRSNPEWMTAYAIAALLGKPYPVAIFSGSSDDGNGGGGGGGGGGGSSSPGFTIVVDSVTSSGRFTEEVTAKSGDGKIKLTISEDTIGKQAGGQSLRTIRITEMNYHPAPPDDSNVIGLVYDLEPDGATFDPPISMTVKYNPALLPDGVSEENLVVAFWDEDIDEWVECSCTVDTGSNTITAAVSHFTAFTTLSSTRPATFTTTDLVITPQEAERGQSVTISVTISNSGDLAGSYEVTLEINDTAVETETVEVAGGDSQSVSFEIAEDTTGTYQVAIDDLTGSFVIGDKVLSVTPPLASPQPANEPATPASPAPPLPPPDQSEPINLPIIGGIIGGLILLVLLIFLVIRHLTD